MLKPIESIDTILNVTHYKPISINYNIILALYTNIPHSSSTTFGYICPFAATVSLFFPNKYGLLCPLITKLNFAPQNARTPPPVTRALKYLIKRGTHSSFCSLWPVNDENKITRQKIHFEVMLLFEVRKHKKRERFKLMSSIHTQPSKATETKTEYTFFSIDRNLNTRTQKRDEKKSF